MTPFEAGQVLHRAVLRSARHLPEFEEWAVDRTTPRGAWVVPRPAEGPVPAGPPPGVRRFVLLSSRWCARTREEALRDLRARAAAHVRHARRRLEEAEARARSLSVAVADPRPLMTFPRPGHAPGED
jgi:hypothetical protein